MELQRIIRTQTDVQAYVEEVWERIPFIRKEERVVAERAHSDANLLEVEEVLQSRHFSKKNAVRDRVRGKECRSEVFRITCFAAVRSKDKSVYIYSVQNEQSVDTIDSLKPRERLQLFRLVMFAKR